ncbi:SPO22-domain-containing protein [Microthyrium microscopicum]|uniref:SPO22-domain-containing protein n=1 Tax=Microthyrium microscopicum TaxID=703497 RepID=A0A6A6U6T7_9PEZI|nr:SPO22-domain-containing protein [Microthyrium microscopicum]
MAPQADAARADKDKRAGTILAFARVVPSRLENNPTDHTLAPELRSHLPTFPLKPPSSLLGEFDAQGTELWNLSTRLIRENGDSNQTMPCLLRVFASYMLDGANGGRMGNWENATRVVKVILRATKTCVRFSEYALGVGLLECAGRYFSQTASTTDVTPEDMAVHQRSMDQYSLLQILLAWKQFKLDVAEQMYQKQRSQEISADPVTAEEFADTFYEIGKEEYNLKKFDAASRWLERACDALADQQLDVLSDLAPDLKMSAMHLLTKSLLALGTEQSNAKAREVVQLMDTEYGDKMLVSLLKLEILSAETQPDISVYHGTLLRLFRSVHLTKPNFKTLMHHIHKLRKFNPEIACDCLAQLLSIRLFESGKMEYIERVTVMRIWITTSNTQISSLMETLRSFLDLVSSNITSSYSPAATHAAQTLLWKLVESSFNQTNYQQTEAICNLANHQLFVKCGDNNKAKISRKIMQCAIARQSWNDARQAFFSMSELAQSSPQSRFLLFKVAIRTEDEQLAAECLDVIVQASTKDATILYACVLESQQASNRPLTIKALHVVLEKYKYTAPEGVHLPAMLRCLIKLLKSEMGDSKLPNPELVENFCRAFEGASAQSVISSLVHKSMDFSKSEWEWFSRNSYNFALEHCAILDPLHLSRLAVCCNQFIGILLSESDEQSLQDLRLRRVFCYFLALVANIVLARAADEIDISNQHYTIAIRHAKGLRESITKLLDSQLDDHWLADLQEKHFDAVKYELEAFIRLKKWDDATYLFPICFEHTNKARVWDTLADLGFLLHEEIVKAGLKPSHQAKTLSFLKDIINHSLSSKTNPMAMARWLRCLFQTALTSNDALAMQCIDQAISAAKALRTLDTCFPQTELEYLTTTAFNHAIDYFSAGDDAGCARWAEKALALAGESDDQGLTSLLQERYSALMWQGKDASDEI